VLDVNRHGGVVVLGRVRRVAVVAQVQIIHGPGEVFC
jgi:hypothetical protein